MTSFVMGCGIGGVVGFVVGVIAVYVAVWVDEREKGFRG